MDFEWANCTVMTLVHAQEINKKVYCKSGRLCHFLSLYITYIVSNLIDYHMKIKYFLKKHRNIF